MPRRSWRPWQAEAAAEREDAASMQQHEAEEASEDGGAAEAGELQLTS